jgi:TIR domain
MNYRKKWDVFICHASEDKREIADPLANKLTSMGLKVWYDKFSMRWGSRLMKEIDNGLVNSKYGIVILSNAFFDKGWPQRELEALFSLMVSEDNKDMILPLLHKVKFEDVKVRCPLISGILCRPSDIGIDALAEELVEVVRNKIARKQDMLQMTNKSHLALSNSIHLTSTSVELGELEEAKAAKLLRQFTNPGTPEVREAAYSELYVLCSKKKVWKQEHIWKILDSLLLHPKKDSSDMRDSLAILDNILKSASRTSDMNEVTDRISHINID